MLPLPAGPPLRRGLGVLTLAGTIFIFISSGPYGLEPMVRGAGPGAAPAMLIVTLLFWGLSHVLVATELSAAIPEEGGFARWIGLAFGETWGFTAAWWYWIKMLADTSIYPILFCEYLKYWIPDLGRWEERVVRVAVIWIFVGLNLRGIRTGGRLAVVFTLLLLAPFAVFVLLGAPRFSLAALTPFLARGSGRVEALGVGLLMGMWCYNTLDSVPIVAGEVERPARAFGRAYALAVPALFLGYLLPVVVGLGVDPDYAAWDDHHFATLGLRLGGAWLGTGIALGGVLSNLSLFHGALMINTRVPLVLARRGRFPAAFAAVTRSSGAPWVSLLFDGAVYTLIALVVERFVDLIVWNQWLNAGIYTLLYLSFLRLRATRPDLQRPFRVPGGWAGALAVCAGPFLICWLGVPLAGRRLLWAGLLGLLSGPCAAWLLARLLRPPRSAAAPSA
jgi:amino acid transporter